MGIRNTIYLDYQATTPLDSRVLAEMTPYLVGPSGNPHAVDHSLGWEAAQATENAAASVARLIGADADEIVFTSGATESNNLALLGLGRRGTGGKRRRILVSTIEHKCVLAASRILQDQLGYEIDYVPVDDEGLISIEALEKSLNDDVFLVSIMAANNEIGTIQDIGRLSSVIRASGAIFHCDAAQAPCAMNLGDMAEFVDLVSLSSHKMYGPMGIGALFIKRHLQGRIEPLIYGGGQQRGLRSGTVPVALCVGMGAAATLIGTDEARQEREVIRQRRDRLVKQLTSLSWQITANGPKNERRHPGNANLCFKGFSAADILSALQPRVAASTGSACTSGIPEPSHVLRAIGLPREDTEASIRFSLGRGTSDEDIDEAAQLIDQTLSRLASQDLMQIA